MARPKIYCDRASKKLRSLRSYLWKLEQTKLTDPIIKIRQRQIEEVKKEIQFFTQNKTIGVVMKVRNLGFDN